MQFLPVDDELAVVVGPATVVVLDIVVLDEFDDEFVVVVFMAETVVVLDIVADEMVRVVPAVRVAVVGTVAMVVSGATVVCEGRP
jgi:hypothetical protein